jgi:hypothetical protein
MQCDCQGSFPSLKQSTNVRRSHSTEQPINSAGDLLYGSSFLSIYNLIKHNTVCRKTAMTTGKYCNRTNASKLDNNVANFKKCDEVLSGYQPGQMVER